MKHHSYDDRENDEVVVNCEVIEAGLNVLASNYLDLMGETSFPFVQYKARHQRE